MVSINKTILLLIMTKLQDRSFSQEYLKINFVYMLQTFKIKIITISKTIDAQIKAKKYGGIVLYHLLKESF